MMLVQVRHNIEVAHRLSLLPGKCENIHGHSMWVELSLVAFAMDSNNILVNKEGDPLEFGSIKNHFRRYLDENYDHRLLLNKDDPWARSFVPMQPSIGEVYVEVDDLQQLPGLKTLDGDPSTENIARIIAQWAAQQYRCDTNVLVRETAVNAVAMGAVYDWED